MYGPIEGWTDGKRGREKPRSVLRDGIVAHAKNSSPQDQNTCPCLFYSKASFNEILLFAFISIKQKSLSKFACHVTR